MFATPTAGQLRVLSAARSLIKNRGYAEVSLRQIAAEAGYSPAGIYAHFPGWEGILHGLAEVVRGELSAKLKEAAGQEADPGAQLVAIGLAYIAFAQAHPAEFDVLFRFTRSRKRAQTDPHPSSFDLLRQIARRGAPSATADEVDSACLGLWSTAHGLANLKMAHLADVPLDWDGYARRIFRNQIESLLCSKPRA